jgi:hypothetical protein
MHLESIANGLKNGQVITSSRERSSPSPDRQNLPFDVRHGHRDATLISILIGMR